MGISTLIGTRDGIVRTTDYRMAPEGRWSRKLVEDVVTSFEEFVCPSTSSPGTISIDAPVPMPDGAPEPADETVVARRAR